MTRPVPVTAEEAVAAMTAAAAPGYAPVAAAALIDQLRTLADAGRRDITSAGLTALIGETTGPGHLYIEALTRDGFLARWVLAQATAMARSPGARCWWRPHPHLSAFNLLVTATDPGLPGGGAVWFRVPLPAGGG